MPGKASVNIFDAELPLGNQKVSAVAEHLTMAGDAEALAADQAQAEPLWLRAADLDEPLAERLIQAGSRWAGIASFVVGLGAVALWLLG